MKPWSLSPQDVRSGRCLHIFVTPSSFKRPPKCLCSPCCLVPWHIGELYLSQLKQKLSVFHFSFSRCSSSLPPRHLFPQPPPPEAVVPLSTSSVHQQGYLRFCWQLVRRALGWRKGGCCGRWGLGEPHILLFWRKWFPGTLWELRWVRSLYLSWFLVSEQAGLHPRPLPMPEAVPLHI